MQTYPIYFMLPLHFLPYHVNKSCDGDHTGREHLSVARLYQRFLLKSIGLPSMLKNHAKGAQ